MLASIVIQELKTKFETDSSVGVACIYCNFNRTHEQKLEDLLSSLLKQLAQGQLLMPDAMKKLCEKHKKHGSRPSTNEILDTLHCVILSFSKVFLIIDALDECQVKDGCRARFMSEILSLQANRGASLMATSRFIPDITDKFKSATKMEIRACETDVRRYLEGRIQRLPKCVSESPDLQEKIQAAIVKTVDGMYVSFNPLCI